MTTDTGTTDRESMTTDECALHDCQNVPEAGEVWCLDCRKGIVRAGQEIV